MSAAPASASPATVRKTLRPLDGVRRWWIARLPRAEQWTLGQRNVYILPTRAGFAFALTLVLMLVASINYQLSLGYVLTFLLAGSGIVSMHLTHATLRGLKLRLRVPGTTFAGDPATLEVLLDNDGSTRHGVALRWQEPRDEGGWSWCDVPAGGTGAAHLALVPSRRGWHDVPPIVVETRFPLGLFRAWSVWRPSARVLAWPRPEVPAAPLPAATASAGAPTTARRTAGGELDGVRPWRRGDTLRQVAWKKVARSGEMVSRETTGSAGGALWLEWAASAAPGLDVEQRVARMAAWVLAADLGGLRYGLRLPGHERPPADGDSHRRDALDLLAQWR